jgi:hypothetical protein
VTVLLGSGEHYGWDRPRPAHLVRVLDGDRVAAEFAWIHAEAGTGHEEIDVAVRPRFGEPVWREPAPGERVQVSAWTLGADAVRALGTDPDDVGRWTPPKPLPDLWLWVEG